MKKKKMILISLISLSLAGVFVGTPLTIDNKHPQPHPKSEACKNLKILRYLEEEYYAQKGRYVPEPDSTVYYKYGETSIQSVLPHFKPGLPEGLNFEYELTTSANGAHFIAIARGKMGSKVAGETYSIDQAHEKNW